MRRRFTVFLALLLTGLLAASPSLQTVAAPKKGAAAKAAKKPVPKKAAKPAAKDAKDAKGPSQPVAAAAPSPGAQPIAVPRPQPEEVNHTAIYDAAIEPVRNVALSDEDAARLREAIAAASAGRISQVKTVRDQVRDIAARKLIDWYMYRGGYGTATEIRAFLEANPAWPDQGLLNQRSEEALFASNLGSRDIKTFFAKREPQTGIGLAALASAYKTDNEEARAKALATKAWADYDIPASL
jgi:soluble lytic murein transglycosylase